MHKETIPLTCYVYINIYLHTHKHTHTHTHLFWWCRLSGLITRNDKKQQKIKASWKKKTSEDPDIRSSSLTQEIHSSSQMKSYPHSSSRISLSVRLLVLGKAYTCSSLIQIQNICSGQCQHVLANWDTDVTKTSFWVDLPAFEVFKCDTTSRETLHRIFISSIQCP
jgi:hypothetical protein